VVSADRGSGDDGYGSLPLQVGLVLIVGASGAFVSIQAGADLGFVLLAGLAGLVLGAVITWFLVRNIRAIMPDVDTRKRRNR